VTFAAMPAALVGALMALAGATVLALYLLRRTPRTQTVSNIRFWVKAAESAKPRWLFRFRIPLLALLVSLLVALLLVALAGDPRFGDGTRGTTVIVLAAGRTMGASAEGERRIERAVVEVRRWVERSTIEGDVAVIRAGMRPSVLVPMTSRAGDLERALVDLEVDDGPADLEGALAVADALLAEHLSASAAAGAVDPRGQILLVTDTAFAPRTRASTVVLPVGTPVDTLAITSFAARRVPTAVGEYAARIEVANFSSRQASVRVAIADGEVPILDERIVLGPHERRALEAGGFSARRAELHAGLEAIAIAGSADGLPADDEAFAVVDALERTRVLLVTEGDLYLEAALAAHPGLEVEVLNGAALAAESAGSLASYAGIVLDGVALPAGIAHPSVLAFDPPEDGPVALRRAVRSPRITAMLGSHPALEGVRFDGVHVERARPIVERPGDQVLLRSDDRALAIARSEPSARLVAFSFGTEDTDLVRGEAFPLLVHHALRWVSDHGEPTPLSRRVGGALASEAGLAITGPDGEAVAASIVPTVTESGVWDLGGRRIAFDATEHARELGAGATGGTFAAASSVPPLGFLLAAALLALMLIEWALLHRGRLG
jgi:hypothetical protein